MVSSQYPYSKGQTITGDPVFSYRTDYDITTIPEKTKVFDLLYDNVTNSLWYTGLNESSIYNLDLTTGNVTQYPTGNPKITPNQIVFGKNRTIWFTDYDFEIVKSDYDYFGRFNIENGTYDFYKIPTLNSAPVDIEYSFGYIWVSEWLGDKVLRFDPNTGVMDEKILECGSASCTPLGIAYDENSVYILETGRASIISYNPDSFEENGQIQIPDKMPGPVDILVDGELLWLGIHGGDQLAWYNLTSGEFSSKYSVLPDSNYPISGINEVKKTDDGLLWFSEHFVNWMGNFNPETGVITEYRVNRDIPSNTQWLTTDGQRVWYAETDNMVISEFDSSAVPKMNIKAHSQNVEQDKVSTIEFEVELTSGALTNNSFKSFVYPIFTYGISLGKSYPVDLSTGKAHATVGIEISSSVRPGNYNVIIGVESEELLASVNIQISVNPSFTALYYLGGLLGALIVIIIILKATKKI